MIDKSKELRTAVSLINDKLRFSAKVDNQEPLFIDYIPPLGDGAGYTSLELLLLSLSSCIGSAVLVILRKMNRSISGLEVCSCGYRKEKHPTGFRKIEIVMNIQSEDVTNGDMENVLRMSEETYCPVWSMLKGNVDVEISHRIN